MDLLKEVPDKSINCIITDPPYGIDYQSARRIDTERFDKLKGDDVVSTESLKELYRILCEDGALYLFTRWDVFPQWVEQVKKSGFMVKNCIIWNRVVHGLGDLNGSYAPMYDMIIFATKGNHKLKNGRPKDILTFKRVEANKLVHPTQKPVSLIRHLILNSTDEKDIILDCFAGSGTTLVASKQTNRQYIGIEIVKEYCDIAERRLSQKTLSEVSLLSSHD